MVGDKFGQVGRGQIIECWGSLRNFEFYSKSNWMLLRVSARDGIIEFTFKMTKKKSVLMLGG